MNNMKRKLKIDIKKVIIYVVLIFLVFSMAYTVIMFTIASNTSKVTAKQVEETEKQLVNVEKSVISGKINRLVSDVLYISDSISISGFSENSYDYISQEWMAFSDRKKIYDHIRFIDVQGNEVIRINYSDQGSYKVAKEDLQNKSDRYYFTDTIDLNINQVFISKFDLNVENNVIEEPIKPMIRFSTPVFDDSGNLMGIVVLNYYGSDLLQQIEQVATTSNGNVFLLNSESYWLFNSESNKKTWAFMFEDRADEDFENKFSDEWNEIKDKEKGTIITGNGLFAYSNILTDQEFIKGHQDCELILDEGDWYIVSYVPGESEIGKVFIQKFEDNLLNVFKENIPVYIFILVVAILFAMLMNMNRVQKEKTKYFSEYDSMTGVYNRRAGLEKLSRIYKDTNRSNGKMSICFIDINGLKEVNDNFGHEAGDELILSVLNGIKKNIRNTDFVARLGGDEFLIVFNNTSADAAEIVWDRINEYYNLINETENRKYLISVSHGVEDFKFNANEYIDNIINSADEKMYNEKRILKKDLEIIRGKRT